MVAVAIALLLAQAPPLGPEDARRSAVASALRHASHTVEPIPLRGDSPDRGVIFDRVRLLTLAAREQAARGTVSQETLMAVDVPNLVVIAYPLVCGGIAVPAARMDLQVEGAPVRSRAMPIASESLARLLPGVGIPAGAAAIVLNRIGPGAGVVVTYADNTCEREAEMRVQITPPRKIRNVPPYWPGGVMGASRNATFVYLRATIETDGTPQDVAVLSGPSDFNLPAAAAVRQWRYEPMKINGKPSSLAMAVTVSFRIQ